MSHLIIVYTLVTVVLEGAPTDPFGVVGVEVVAHHADHLGGRQHGAEPGGVQRAPELLRRDAPAVQRIEILCDVFTLFKPIKKSKLDLHIHILFDIPCLIIFTW